jgi:hypothetical protein
VPIQSGFVIGLLDGLLGTIFMLYEVADGAIKETQGYFSAASTYLSGLVDHYRKNQTYWSVFTKIGQDSKEAIKAQWDKVVTTFTALKAIVEALELNRIRRLLSSVAAEARVWLGDFIEGDADPAYDVGTIAFEVILAAFTGGAASGIAASAKAGSGFLPRIFKFLNDLEYPESGRFGGLMSTAFTKAQKVTNGRPENPVAYRKNLLCRLGVGGCFIAGTPVLLAGGLAPIDSVQLLQYAVCHQTINQPAGPEAYDPYTSAQQRERDHYEVDSLNWFEVVFQPLNSSSYCKLALHQDWMRRQGIDSVGQYQYLSLPEQGITGLSQITSIRHLLPQKRPVDEDPTDDYGFQPVTGIFVHQSDNVWTLTFDNGDTVGVTANHPIWSVDAGGWRSAGELRVGEAVLSRKGTTLVSLKVFDTGGRQLVWNIEVREKHNYLVDNKGILVHNNYGEIKVIGNVFDFKNPRGSIVRFIKQREWDEGSILARISRTSSASELLELNAALALKRSGVRIKGLGAQAVRRSGDTAGEIDILTDRGIVEVKTHVSDLKIKQMRKYMDPSRDDFINPSLAENRVARKVLVYAENGTEAEIAAKKNEILSALGEFKNFVDFDITTNLTQLVNLIKQ